MDNYVTGDYYGSPDNPDLCLGVYIKSAGNNLYEYSLRFNTSGNENSEIYNTIDLVEITIPFVK